MLVVTAISYKGGVGKTTLGRALICAAEARGMRVAIVDTDNERPFFAWRERGKNQGYWSDERTEYFDLADIANREPLERQSLEEEFSAIVDREDIDLVFVDVLGARHSFVPWVLQSVIDICLIPTGLSVDEMDGARNTGKLLIGLQQAGATVPGTFIVQTRLRPDRQRTVAQKEMLDLFTRMGFPILATALKEKGTAADSGLTGLSRMWIEAKMQEGGLGKGQAITHRKVLEDWDQLLAEILEKVSPEKELANVS